MQRMRKRRLKNRRAIAPMTENEPLYACDVDAAYTFHANIIIAGCDMVVCEVQLISLQLN